MTSIIEPTRKALELYEAYLTAVAADGRVERKLLRAGLRQILQTQLENTSSSHADVASTITQLRRKVSAEDPDAGYINTWNAALDAVAAALADTSDESTVDENALRPTWLALMTESEAKDRVMRDYAKLIRYRTRAEVAEARLASARAGIELAMSSLRIPSPILDLDDTQ